MSSISCECLSHKIDLIQQARCGSIDGTTDGRFGIRRDTGSATFADGSEQDR